MSEALNDLDVVALVQPMPEHGLPVGQTGTIVYVHGDRKTFEVEFPIGPRRSIVATVNADQIMKLKGLSPASAG